MNSKLTKKYYVYKITNLINGKVYIGKRTSDTPETDKYMGSGKLITASIKKYGMKSFSKEILAIFDTEKEAAELEASIVTKEFIKESNTYNLHEGGYGGFSHINSDPRSKEWRLKGGKNSGSGSGSGTKNWTEESWKKVREYSWSNQVKLGNIKPNTWEGISQEEYERRRKKISESNSGSNNKAYGTHIYVDTTIGELLPVKELNKHRYKPGHQPEGWITVTEWKDLRKNRNSPQYGKHWYNDGINNYFCKEGAGLILKLKLTRGRINPTLKRIVVKGSNL